MAKIEILRDHLDIGKDQCGMNEVSPRATAFISIFWVGYAKNAAAAKQRTPPRSSVAVH